MPTIFKFANGNMYLGNLVVDSTPLKKFNPKYNLNLGNAIAVCFLYD